MAHLLSCIETKSINAFPKNALLVEHDDSLLKFLRRSLNDDGYDVHPASNSEEGLRLYHDRAPFNVVLINYCVPRKNGFGINCLAPQTNGTALAMSIREINPSQPMIIAALDYRNVAEVPLPPELMHIPLLIDTSNFQLRRLLAKIEVDQAMEALTPSELLRLLRFADYRVLGLGRAACGRTGDDLLGEAQLRTLIGAGATREGRHWNKQVDFVWHLTGAMRSISNCWKRQFEAAVQREEMEAYLIPAIPIRDVEGQEHSPLDDVPSEHVAADQLLIGKDEEDRILAIFKDDPEATQVLEGLLDGLKKNEMMLTYGFDEKKYADVVKRILKLLGRRNGGGGKGEKHGA